MNPYLKNLNKIEFVVTYACTGRCKHCSEGDHTSCDERINPQFAYDAVRKIAAEYDIKTVMAFGGEPLLYTDAVYAIMTAAKELNIPKRQLITNGYFSKNADKMADVAQRLAACGVNDLLLSVDVFHQETIPLDVVKQFAAEAKKCGIPHEDSRTNSKEMKELLGYIARHHEDLEKSFTDEQKETFEKFHDCWSECLSLAEKAIFVYAFKLGAKMMLETLQ